MNPEFKRGVVPRSDQVDAISLLREMTNFDKTITDIQMVIAIYTEVIELRSKLELKEKHE